MKKISISEIATDEHGRVILTDDQLSAMEKTFATNAAGAGTNSVCSNEYDCRGSINDSCTNHLKCRGSTNGPSCSTQQL